MTPRTGEWDRRPPRDTSCVDGEVGVLRNADSRKRFGISDAARAHPGQAAVSALFALAVMSAVLRAVLVRWAHGPFVFMDELGYERMAQSFAHTGHFALFGKSGLAYSPLYPIVLSPIYALTSSMHTAYEWAKVENAVLISLSVFPVYAIARFVLPRGRSVGVAALSLLAPLMLYSGFEMSESLAYPLCLLAMWAMLRAVRRPGIANDVLLLAAIALASGARLQLVVLFPAALTAILLVALARPNSAERRLGTIRRAVYEHRLLFGAIGLALVAGLARAAMNGGRLPLAGRYANVGTAHASAWRVFALFFQHLAELDFAVGVIPFAAALIAGYALVRLGFPRNALVFTSVAVASTLWLLIEVAFDAAAFDATSPRPPTTSALIDLPRIHERYLIYLFPLFLVALFALVGLRRTALPAFRYLVAGAVVSALLPTLIPFGTVIDGMSDIDSFALHIFGTARSGRTVPIAHATTEILVLSALLAAVFILAVTRWFPPPAAILVTGVVFLGLSTVVLGSQLTPIGRTELGLPAHADWVDRVVGSDANVGLVGGAGSRAAALRETAFWNASITRVYYTCHAAFGPDFGEQELVGGSVIRTQYAVVPASLKIPGRKLAQDREGELKLVAPAHGALRIVADPLCRS
jgi:hypothetical protein